MPCASHFYDRFSHIAGSAVTGSSPKITVAFAVVFAGSLVLLFFFQVEGKNVPWEEGEGELPFRMRTKVVSLQLRDPLLFFIVSHHNLQRITTSPAALGSGRIIGA